MNLGERMKEYEMQSRTRLLKKTPVIIRLDGKAFHTWTRGLDKPFDKDLTYIMQQTLKEVCESVQGCVFGYTQSDEMTLVVLDTQSLEAGAWFDYQVQKMVSVSASIATAAFNKYLYEVFDEYDEEDSKHWLLKSKLFRATFDARAFNLPEHEVVNNVLWRQFDAARNSVNSLGQSLFSHKELQGVSVNKLQDKMFTEKGVNWNDLPTCLKRGTAALKDEEGKWYLDLKMPMLNEDREYLNRLLRKEV